MTDHEMLAQQAYRLTESCLRKRKDATLASTPKVTAMTLKLLEAEVPVEDIEWVLVNARALTEAGIEFTLNNRPAPRRALELVRPAGEWTVAEEERVRVRDLIEMTRSVLRHPSSYPA